MSPRRSQSSDSLLLIAATTLLILGVQRLFEDHVTEKSHPDPAMPVAPNTAAFAREIAQPGRGRLSRNPFEIPWAGWKDIL